jgi:hypothetical protein
MEIVKINYNIHNSIKILFLLLIVNNPSLYGQTNSKEAMEEDFEKFKNASKKEFQQYKDERDKEFADLLKKSWTTFDLENSKEPPKVPLPPKQPEKLPQAPKQNDDKKIPSIKPVSIIFSTDEPVIKITPNNQNHLLPLNKKISFYNVDMTIDTLVTTLPHVKSGRLNGLAVSTSDRANLDPSIPTLQEQGVPDFNMGAWLGFVAPQGTPPAIIKRLHDEVNKALKDPEIAQRLEALGTQVVMSQSPEAFSNLIIKNYDTWGKLIQQAGLEQK